MRVSRATARSTLARALESLRFPAVQASDRTERQTGPVRWTVDCTICSQPAAAAIDAALVAEGTSVSALAREHDVSKTSLLRHRSRHLDKRTGQGAPLGPLPASPAVEPPPAPIVTPSPDRAPTGSGRDGPGRPCTVCASPVRSIIEAHLVEGKPWLTIANIVDGSPAHDSIRRHAQRCVPEMIKRARAEVDGLTAIKMEGDLIALRGAAMRLLQEAQDYVAAARRKLDKGAPDGEGDGSEGADPGKAMADALRTAAQVVGQAKGVVELVGKFTGEIRNVIEVDIRKAKEWPTFIEAIGEAVAGCDACSAAVEAAFSSGEADR